MPATSNHGCPLHVCSGRYASHVSECCPLFGPVPDPWCSVRRGVCLGVVSQRPDAGLQDGVRPSLHWPLGWSIILQCLVMQSHPPRVLGRAAGPRLMGVTLLLLNLATTHPLSSSCRVPPEHFVRQRPSLPRSSVPPFLATPRSYLTLSSPRAMFGAQLIGAVLGCVIAPLCFWLFWTAFPIGVPGTTYFAPCERCIDN